MPSSCNRRMTSQLNPLPLPWLKVETAASSREVENQAKMESGKILAPAIAPRALAWRENNELAISGVATGGVRVVAITDRGDFAEAMVMANGDWTVLGRLTVICAHRIPAFSK